MSKVAIRSLPGSAIIAAACALTLGACSGRDTGTAEQAAAAMAAAQRAEEAATRAEAAAAKVSYRAASAPATPAREPEDDGSEELSANQDPNSPIFDN